MAAMENSGRDQNGPAGRQADEKSVLSKVTVLLPPTNMQLTAAL
jgi:hypothetical protein